MNNVYQVAHIREQGQDMIIVPMDPSINSKTLQQQNDVKSYIQASASSAGLSGTVCLIWSAGNKFSFLAPTQWHAFFRSINMNFVSANINKRLTCNS